MSDVAKHYDNFAAFLLEKLGTDPNCAIADSLKITPSFTFGMAEHIEIEWAGYASLTVRDFYKLVHEYTFRENT